MPLIWGWGPFSIRTQGEEVLLGERVRDVFRRHNASPKSQEELFSGYSETKSAIENLWKSVAKRVQAQERELQIPKGGDDLGDGVFPEVKEVPLVRSLLEASLVASMIGIEYEMKSARCSKYPTKVKRDGRGCWDVVGQATETATHRTMPGFGFSNEFDPDDRNAVESGFLVAATRAYVHAVHAIAPFLPDKNEEEE